MTPEWARLEQLASAMAPPEPFAGPPTTAPPAVRRYLSAAIAPGTPLAAGARLTMRGSIKLGRWLPFRARQLLVPGLGSVWAARVAGLVSGSDRYVGGVGAMEWKLLGAFTVMRASGDDVTRSAAGRVAGESIWVPTAVARAGRIADVGSDGVRVELELDGRPTAVEHRLDPDGLVVASSLQRWGDPDGTGTWALHPFGVDVTSSRTFSGVTIPSAGRAGWHHGTDRWEEGVFFRFEISEYALLA